MSVLQVIKQAKNSTVGLMATAVFFTFGITVGYRWVIKPRMDRTRRAEAEAIANYIYEREQQRKHQE